MSDFVMYLLNVHILPITFVCQCCVNFGMYILNVYCLCVMYPYRCSVNVVLSIIVEKFPMFCNIIYNNIKLWVSPFLYKLIEYTRTGIMKQTPGIYKCLTNHG